MGRCAPWAPQPPPSPFSAGRPREWWRGPRNSGTCSPTLHIAKAGRAPGAVGKTQPGFESRLRCGFQLRSSSAWVPAAHMGGPACRSSWFLAQPQLLTGAQREKERTSLLLAHSPNACQRPGPGQGKPGAGNSIRVSRVGVRAQALEPHCCPPGSESAGSWTRTQALWCGMQASYPLGQFHTQSLWAYPSLAICLFQVNKI